MTVKTHDDVKFDGCVLEVPVASPDDSGEYAVVVTNSAGSRTSSKCVVTVCRSGPPSIVQDLPGSLTVVRGQTLHLEAKGACLRG